MLNKKSLMTVSALVILIFHLWVNLTYPVSQVESFLTKTTYWGVDIFFFLSAYAIAGRRVENYGSFLLGRLKLVYLKYIIFVVIASIYAKWPLLKLIKVIFMVDFFERGGGSFLWFIPGIMLLYLILPLYQRLDEKNRKVTATFTFIIWLAIALIFTYFTKYYKLFIFWNRLPIVFVGFYLGKSDGFRNLLNSKKIRAILGSILLIIGYVLLFYFGYRPQLQMPIKDMFYILAIPADLGIILLVGMIPEISPIKWIGSATLEMYALQMIFGYDIMNKLIKWNLPAIIINVSVMVIIVLPAIILSYIYKKCLRKCS